MAKERKAICGLCSTLDDALGQAQLFLGIETKR
jgi:hypothetical protein